MRKQPGNFGDEIATLPLLMALQGEISVAYSPMQYWQVPIRSAVPIFIKGKSQAGSLRLTLWTMTPLLAYLEKDFSVKKRYRLYLY